MVGESSSSAGGSGSAVRVEELVEQLRIMAVEAHPVVLDDEDDFDPVAPDCALVRKADTTRVIDGSLWMVGKHAMLFKTGDGATRATPRFARPALSAVEDRERRCPPTLASFTARDRLPRFVRQPSPVVLASSARPRLARHRRPPVLTSPAAGDRRLRFTHLLQVHVPLLAFSGSPRSPKTRRTARHADMKAARADSLAARDYFERRGEFVAC
ncbi:uncharacterized protein LOC123450816 [Hordeum vulgare subsp. vulgare]|uniref:uncharacterized protein LOC123450816 n=1 Tax=Hordeum vulgare subsp. vulgare TaxID=112509 RepID=UPI001D1A46D5|nr:uncharacterized protein LOC123450816 [Hordeum vulgare subsp. vulgare]